MELVHEVFNAFFDATGNSVRSSSTRISEASNVSGRDNLPTRFLRASLGFGYYGIGALVLSDGTIGITYTGLDDALRELQDPGRTTSLKGETTFPIERRREFHPDPLSE